MATIAVEVDQPTYDLIRVIGESEGVSVGEGARRLLGRQIAASYTRDAGGYHRISSPDGDFA